MWDKCIIGTSKQTAKISETSFAKIGLIAVSKPQRVGFQVEQLIMTNLKVGEKAFSITLGLDFFHQNHLSNFLIT